MSSIKSQTSTLPSHYPLPPLGNRENEELLRINCSADTNTKPDIEGIKSRFTRDNPHADRKPSCSWPQTGATSYKYGHTGEEFMS
ncbi:hypothetical protein N7454_005321 [Penicillium verhagenii]|nr:hypothetical protein N7454_005321 [Penicillium verhagenii]